MQVNQPKVSGAKASTSAGPVEIVARLTTGTYVARAKGHKVTASCAEGPRAAARAVARKLGLDPESLQEQTDLFAAGLTVFIHPGVVA